MKIKENGRSMVEMLGVLAIIGVLSAGALAGYSKVMFQHKLNQQAEQIDTLIAAVTKYQKDLYGLSRLEIFKVLAGLGEFPANMIKNNGTYDSFFNEVYVTSKNNETIILFILLGGNGYNTMRECQSIAKVAKNWSSEIFYLETLSGWNTEGLKQKSYYGDSLCTKGSNCLSEITINQINELCMLHLDKTAYYTEFKIWWKKSNSW